MRTLEEMTMRILILLNGFWQLDLSSLNTEMRPQEISFYSCYTRDLETLMITEVQRYTLPVIK